MKINNKSVITSNTTSGLSSLMAILGGVCCWAPPVFSVIGVGASTGGVLGSAASFLGVIAPYRNYFLILNILGMFLSFFFIYVMPKMLNSLSNTGVSDPTCKCEAKPKDLFSPDKLIFFSSLAITVGIFVYLYANTGSVFMAWPSF